MTAAAPQPAGRRSREREPWLQMPTFALLAASVGPGVLVVGGAGALAMAFEWPLARIQGVGLGAAVAAGAALAGTIVLAPWKRRRAGDFPVAWMGATLVRLLLTLTLLLLLYSSTPSAEGFLLAAGATYLSGLAAEAAVISRSMRRTFPQAGPDQPAPPSL
ncbi:MAG: hypothetical protein U0574_01260 [Phycisphaerales bacterium]